ncbi:putative Glycine--tRNA ligase, chloroplastic/mitochondrial 2 [Cocos nucifera]|uniref:glycine--tRNA ligase n=1 Tax=Cocos nucifera TaxID=13894 RepID=A0A8K0N753_COCNU|nr:putative Glycine--tRNA ligase, chloroplastic/mitochondrial 2 [Cocos nucifera]
MEVSGLSLSLLGGVSPSICVENLSSKQEENEVEIRGPPAAKAFDQEGNPTKAAEGFCRKNCVPIDNLYNKVEGKTEYVYVRVKKSARSALQVMFSRPIRWILALYGDMVVPFMFAGVSRPYHRCHHHHHSNFKTLCIKYGVGYRAELEIEKVETAESYLGTMKNAGILINIKERKEKILCDSTPLAMSVGGHLVMQDNLLGEVVNLVEAPVPILGGFDESFLELPEDILITVMQRHQKYFPLTNISTGKLLPFFVTVANGIMSEAAVQKGNEAVLRARYEDAKFFYRMDTQKKFSEFRVHLNGILFHEKLGTMLDKMSRVQKTVGKLTLALGIDESNLPVIEDAAALAMSDLATSIVTEFTSLSGIMARHYALRDGYSEQIADALFEMTLPRFSGDILPKSDAGIVLAIADRYCIFKYNYFDLPLYRFLAIPN